MRPEVTTSPVPETGGEINWFSLDIMHGPDPALVEASWKLYWDVSRACVGADADSAIFALDRHQGLRLYFTPSAGNLAKTVGAVSCGKPGPHGLRLIAGDESAGPMHFGVAVPKSL